MAKNWTIKEAYEAIKAEDKSAILDFGKRFPLAAMAVARMQQADLLVTGLPEHVTMRKLNDGLKDGVEAFEDDDKPTKEAPTKKATGKRGRPSKSEVKVRESEKKEAAEEAEDNPYKGMSAVELFKLCKKRGITVQPKQKSAVYIDLLKAADKKLKAEEEDEEDEDDWEDGDNEDEEEEEEVKKPAKKPSKASAKPVKAAKKSEPEDDEDGDDWDI